MLFFTALLAISLAGLTVLFVSKHIESRTGQPFLLPERVRARDVEIERAARSLLRRGTLAGHRLFHASARAAHTGLAHGWERLRALRSRALPKLLDTNGGGSVYLKQVMEHKNSVRNGNGRSGPSSEPRV